MVSPVRVRVPHPKKCCKSRKASKPGKPPPGPGTIYVLSLFRGFASLRSLRCPCQHHRHHRAARHLHDQKGTPISAPRGTQRGIGRSTGNLVRRVGFSAEDRQRKKIVRRIVRRLAAEAKRATKKSPFAGLLGARSQGSNLRPSDS